MGEFRESSVEEYRENSFIDPRIIEKWLPVIEGTSEKWEKFVSNCPKIPVEQYGLFAKLCENIIEDNKPKGNAFFKKEATGASAVGGYAPILIPMLRRTLGAQIGPRIFGTQPMSGPTGLIFALRSFYSGDSNNVLEYAKSKIVFVANAQAFDVDAPIVLSGSVGNAEGVVRFKQNNVLLVEVLSGTFVAGVNESESGVDNETPFSSPKTYITNVFENEASTSRVYFKNYTGPYQTSVGEKLASDMKEMSFDIQTANVYAKNRKAKVKFTEELQEDLQALNNINASSLLTKIASQEFDKEMNREFFDLAYSKVGGTYTWDYEKSDGRYEHEKIRTLFTAISRVKTALNNYNHRGPATFAIVSPDVGAILSSNYKFEQEKLDPMNNVFMGRAWNMDFYIDQWKPNESIFLGYKGSDEYDAGIFYCPYVQLQARQGYGEEDGQPRTIFRSRYGIEDNLYGAENYYREIELSNLPGISMPS